MNSSPLSLTLHQFTEILQRMYGPISASIVTQKILHFVKANISFNIARKELRISLNIHFHNFFLHLVRVSRTSRSHFGLGKLYCL